MSDDSMGAKLWDEHPGERLRDVIMLPRTRDDAEVAMFYDEAANRLADSFRGQPFDDTMLIPWLNHRRHALELSLKGLIRAACRLRRTAGHADTVHPLDPEELNNRLRYKISHNLTALVIELDAHLTALDLDPLDPEMRQHIEAVAEVDEKGMSFRYASQLPTAPQRSDGGHPQIRLDFPSLRRKFATRYDTLTGLFTVLELQENAFDF